MIGMKLIIHRGAAQIGGTCIEVSTASTRVILDAGLPLDCDPFDTKANAAACPNVPGLFAPGPKIDAVLFSHAHGDHTGLIPYITPGIPLLCTKGTSKMLMAGAIFARQPEIKNRDVLRPFKETRIGDIAITPLPVDHSSFESAALLVEANGARLFYSGDLRLHGRDLGKFAKLKEHISGKQIDALVMEGTNLRSNPSKGYYTEQEVETALRTEMHRELGPLILVSFSPQHVDRLVSAYKATVACGREFVVDVYAAFVLHLVNGASGAPQPVVEKGIRVYYPQSFNRTWKRRNLQKIHDMFLKDRISLTEVLENRSGYTMLFRPSMLDMDFHGQLPERTLLLYSQWSGYLDKPEYLKVRSALNRAGGRLVECHTSGHIHAEDMKQFVNAVNPTCVIPVHTNVPKKFDEMFPNVRALPDGSEFQIGGSDGH